MAELSPAAQAVLDAANKAYDQAGTVAEGTAAALRAVANLVVPRRNKTPWGSIIKPSAEALYLRDAILAIAAELES